MKKIRFEEVSAAAQILVRYPGRSALTMLGLAIGVLGMWGAQEAVLEESAL